MKKKNLVCAMMTIAALSLSSCASYTNSGAVMSVQSNNLNTYVEADIDYQGAKKVDATVESKKLFGFISLSRNGNKQFSSSNRYKGLTKAEKQALYRAKSNAGVDIILEPEFVTEKHSWFFGAYKTYTVKVSGWGANIKGIKEDKHGVANALQ